MSYDELMKAYQKTQIEIKKLALENENLNLELNNLKRIVFGKKRESTPKQEQVESALQCSLFDEQKPIDEETKKQVEEKLEEIIVHRKKNTKEKKAGIKKAFLKDVTVELKEYKLNEEVKCPECGHDLKEIAKEVVRQEITYIPAKLVISNYVQYTYKCTNCGGNKSDKESATFFKAKLPNPLLTHSIASASLVAQVMYQKYYMGVPLYRQEKMWDDIRISTTKKYDGELVY